MDAKEELTFTVHVTVDPRVVVLAQDRSDNRSPAEVVADEIESNLDSVPYVKDVSVRQNKEQT